MINLLEYKDCQKYTKHEEWLIVIVNDDQLSWSSSTTINVYQS